MYVIMDLGSRDFKPKNKELLLLFSCQDKTITRGEFMNKPVATTALREHRTICLYFCQEE